MPIQHFISETSKHISTPSTPTSNGKEYKVLIAITVPTRNWKKLLRFGRFVFKFACKSKNIV
ncbi:unnamed protein product [Heterobilharzia americana]|nr:unnamed protein product [Heterobilharzia americana]